MNIDELQANFEKKFFDIRKHRPKKGQILASYKAIAHLVDAPDKRNLINILQNNTGAETARIIMRNAIGAVEEDCIKVPLEMAKDLDSGMSIEEVAKKEYPMTVAYSFWTERENVPVDDPHWFTIDIQDTTDMDNHVKFSYTLPD